MSVHSLCSVIIGLLSVINNRVSVNCVSSMFVLVIIGCVHCVRGSLVVFTVHTCVHLGVFLFIVLCFVVFSVCAH